MFSEGFWGSPLVLIMKRVIGLTAGMVGLVVSTPMMIHVAVAIRLDSKGSVIYRQKRVFGGSISRCLKFRSMRSDAERSGAQWAVAKDPRVTCVGRFLPKYWPDELPQFINVIRGEMRLGGAAAGTAGVRR